MLQVDPTLANAVDAPRERLDRRKNTLQNPLKHSKINYTLRAAYERGLNALEIAMNAVESQ